MKRLIAPRLNAMLEKARAGEVDSALDDYIEISEFSRANPELVSLGRTLDAIGKKYSLDALLKERLDLVASGVDSCTTIVCIVTPAFNSAETIGQTIRSVVDQQGDFVLKYHVQDAGSSDDTIEICKHWGQQLKAGKAGNGISKLHFSYHSEPDSGMYDGLVKGFRKILTPDIPKHTWMGWINSDDQIEDGAFSLLSEIDRSNQSEKISWLTGCKSIRREDGTLHTYAAPMANELVSRGLCDGEHWRYIQQEGTFWRKALWDEINAEVFLTEHRFAGDWRLWFELAQIGRLFQADRPLGTFNVRPDQISQTSMDDYQQEIDRIVPLSVRKAAFKKMKDRLVCVNEVAQANGSRKLLLSDRWILVEEQEKEMPDRVDDPDQDAGFVGEYLRYPTCQAGRLNEGGRRLNGEVKTSRPDMPLVSIVTPVYENPETLQRCLDSVRGQSYENIEHIVVDGGSGQATQRILQDNSAELDYFISEPDGGIYAAMNKGISLAQGEYICLLNSDDFYEPTFVEKAVARAQATGADIVYTDYRHGGQHLMAQPLNEGVYFGHLNICHNTFLASRRSYETVGPYHEGFRIVSDALWIRKAHRAGLSFERLPEVLFTLSEGGMSSGSTEAQRQLFIGEMAKSYQATFPQLDEEEAKAIYLFRFSRNRTKSLLPIARRHCREPGPLREALARYVEYCFAHRKEFEPQPTDSDAPFSQMAELTRLVGADPKCIRIDTRHGPFPELLEQIDALVAKKRQGGKRTVLHYLTVFSAPSETFVYDLLTRMQESEETDNFVIFEDAQLEKERPFANRWHMPWPDFKPAVASELYRYFLRRLAPDVVIAHFAINAHRFHQRIAPLGLSFPTVVMTHGIDVFNLKSPSEYTDYVVNDLSRRKDVVFTAVSRYLKREIVLAGVPPRKVTVLPNTVNSRFFAHRKTSGFWDGVRPLELLCIGRLIAWKGHDILIEALAVARKTSGMDLRLTLVYGNGDERLEAIREQIEGLGLTEQVRLLPFVDFAAEPDFMARFDLYVHPSTYTDDHFRKSETFGVAALEAIAAGLPIIATDAGGLPEVIGQDGRHARIVPHGNAGAMADAILDMSSAPGTFTDNRDYAKARLALFSPRRQQAGLARLMEKAIASPVQVAIFSTYTIYGAGYAAFRLHRGLRDTSISSRMFTTVRDHERESDVTVVDHPSGDEANWKAKQFVPKAGLTMFSVDETHIPTSRLLELVAPYDVINVHWHARFLSIDNVAALTHSGKPVVMTVRDMQPITGGCHFFHGCTRWQGDCRGCPQLPDGYGEISAAALAAKRAGYNFDNLTLVALSNHTRGILEQAPYFRDCRIETIPNSIETDIFRPQSKSKARAEFGLPQDRKIIGYVPSASSEVKGYKEILAAFARIEGRISGDDPFVMLVGNETPATQGIRLDKKSLGYINDNQQLARAYCAADVIVVPSLEETFSNTTAEAISCGVPVVGFKTGAIPDLAIDGKTGFTFPVGDVDGLAKGIVEVLTGPEMGPACRTQALLTLSFQFQALRYESLFAELADAAAGRPSEGQVSSRRDGLGTNFPIASSL